MNKLQRVIILLWAVVLGTIAMSVVAAGLLLGTRKGAGRRRNQTNASNLATTPCRGLSIFR
jgi:hypothetical protein